MSKAKISNEQLKEEINQGKTYKEIAHEYGFGYPSRPLSRKMWDIGFSKNRELPGVDENGGFPLYVNPKQLEMAKEQKGLEDVDNEDLRYVRKAVDGMICFKLTEREWSKKEVEE